MGNLRRPSLDGATLRLERAARHFNEFEQEGTKFQRSNKDKVIVTQDSDKPPTFTVSFDKSLVVPPYLSLPVSDCIHNLRSALDYLIYELAFLDSGTFMDGTQFPIEDDSAKFNLRRRKTYLRGLSDVHIRAIESLQPYNGVDWTKTLRTISNPDKHRQLTVLQPQRSPVVYTHVYGESDDVVVTLNGEQWYLTKAHVLTIGFAGSSTPVAETLNLLLVRVGESVNTFKSDFK
jgi:hypothetical protein